MPFYAFYVAYSALSDSFQQPVDFSQFDFRVPKEQMTPEMKARATLANVRYDPRTDSYADFSTIPLEGRQIRSLRRTTHKLGSPIDQNQTAQHMGIMHNVRLIF